MGSLVHSVELLAAGEMVAIFPKGVSLGIEWFILLNRGSSGLRWKLRS
jgi:hypothetical protein